MQLTGACHCGSVRFQVQAAHPYPFLRWYCAICRKTAGTGGCSINLGADYARLTVEGKESISVYRPIMRDSTTGEETLSPGERHFCNRCGTALWIRDPRWPELVHPYASAIDTPLPAPRRIAT